MPRRQPFSNKQKKAQLHNKRAEKRGEAEDEGGAAGGRKKKAAAQARRPGVSRSENAGPRLALESRFVAIPRQYLEKTRDTAYAYPLPRPLPDEAAAFPLHLVANPAGAPLCVPARPRFRYGQTKKEVEKNEEGVFRKWLAGTRAVVEEWVEQGRWDAAGGKEGEEGEEGGNHGLEWIHSPSWFETNLEVWRQL
jgi:hypothetical protein